MNTLRFLFVALIANPFVVWAAEPIEFQGETIAGALKQLGRQAGVRVVVDHGVAGAVTIRLEETTPKEAIDIIIEAKNLRKFEGEGVLVIDDPAVVGKASKEPEPLEDGIDGFVRSVSTVHPKGGPGPCGGGQFRRVSLELLPGAEKEGFHRRASASNRRRAPNPRRCSGTMNANQRVEPTSLRSATHSRR
jgi:hypothetical protein